jgi:hypothetical protein
VNSVIFSGASEKFTRSLGTHTGCVLALSLVEDLVSVGIGIDAITVVLARPLDRVSHTDAGDGGVVKDTRTGMIRHHPFELVGGDPARG